jgi:hypothetical protein
MFCRTVKLRLLCCVTVTVLVTEGHILASPNVDSCYIHDLAEGRDKWVLL